MIPAIPPPEIPVSSLNMQMPVSAEQVYQVSSSSVVGHSEPELAVSSQAAQIPSVYSAAMAQTMVVQFASVVQVMSAQAPVPEASHVCHAEQAV